MITYKTSPESSHYNMAPDKILVVRNNIEYAYF